MFEHDTGLEKALSFSRFDTAHFLSTCSDHPFDLDGKTWPCAEYYYHANMLASPLAIEKVMAAATGKEAYHIGSAWFRFKRKGYKNLRKTMMTRALYTKAMAHENIKLALLATDNQPIVETSMYDHYWGLGRDQRGENMLGKVWVDIRDKIRKDEQVKTDEPLRQSE